MSDRLATHTIHGSAVAKVCPFTLDFVSALLHKNGWYLHEERGLTTRTFSLRAVVPVQEDVARAREDSAGQSYESEHHELSPLERQREAWALGNAEGEEAL